MKTCTVIRHVLFEDLGSFEAPIIQSGYAVRYLEAGIDDLNAANDSDLTVILGGPIGVCDVNKYPFLYNELSIIRTRLLAKKPLIGISLGAQLIAKAANAKVYLGIRGKEIGWKPIVLTEEGHQNFIAPLGEENVQMFHWHGDTFDLPDGATRLASTDLYENQLFSIDRHVLAFQCHPELNCEKIEQWLIGHAFEIVDANVDLLQVRQNTQKYGKRLTARGVQVIEFWIKQLLC